MCLSKMNTTLARSLEVGGSACSGMRQKPRIEVASCWQPEQWAEPSEASQKVKLPQRHCQNSGSGFAGGLNSTTDMAFRPPMADGGAGQAPANRLIAEGKGAAPLVNRGLTAPARFLCCGPWITGSRGAIPAHLPAAPPHRS